MAKAIVKRVIRFALGAVFLLVGVIGIFLPGIQGIACILVGVGLMFPGLLRRFGRRLKQRYPNQAAKLTAAQKRLAERWRNRSHFRRRAVEPEEPAPEKTGLENK